ncbi:hypothetical protein DUNSADRAFT_15221 [Dunaliella salina]|uniref:Acyl-CoA oxidase C-alpha1 domain-containing protein n=1 Tax=Dunaliella salina TaxID=3046 RepID=A0ABQ7H1W5_DUNSA|nr:hypothetical protein DUNSADRAFT_15221 [Dunaliella salina]|eukprot:KAF5840853.1 hypothetical protein DUNSADRAFT_15221 [Dunaliella salina]
MDFIEAKLMFSAIQDVMLIGGQRIQNTLRYGVQLHILASSFELTAGRVLIAQGGVDGQKMGLTIAIRYACSRPQFGSKNIMEYLTHKNRLLPPLSSTYALQLAMRTLKVSQLVGRGN